MYWIFVYKYDGPLIRHVTPIDPHSYRGFKEVLNILCKVPKVKGGLKETLREWEEDTKD